MTENSTWPLPKGMEAELVLERLRSDRTLEALQQEALLRLKDNVSEQYFFPAKIPLPLSLSFSQNNLALSHFFSLIDQYNLITIFPCDFFTA
jgi:hypothetical protein